MSVQLPVTVLLNNKSYLLTSKIGQGGYGKVYKAERNGKQFAIKIMKRNQTNKELFSSEITCLKHLGDGSENVQKYVSFFVSHSSYYLITHLIDNSIQLEEFIPKTIEIKTKIIKDLVSACKYLDEKLVRHCDIKPQNILVQTCGSYYKAVLIDFGFSFVESVGLGITGFSNNYVSPEKFIDFRKSGKESDVYSLGLVFFFVLVRLRTYDVIRLLEPSSEVAIKKLLESYLKCEIKHSYFVEKIRVLLLKYEESITKIILEMVNFESNKRPTIQIISDKLSLVTVPNLDKENAIMTTGF